VYHDATRQAVNKDSKPLLEQDVQLLAPSIREAVEVRDNHMLKHNIYFDLLRCWFRRLLFLVCLAFFALAAAADAYSDSLCSPLIFLNGQNDSDDPVITDELNLNDNLSTVLVVKDSESVPLQYQSPLEASIEYWPAYSVKKIQISANNIRSPQICPLLSSDPSPPVV
jgi:hypothetical protein